MTTENDDLKERKNRFGEGYVEKQGVNETAFGDPSGEHPNLEYENASGINKGARTGMTHQLSYGGSVAGHKIMAGVPTSTGAQYPYVDVKQTSSGHVLEFNDTPSGERILIKHNTGAGIEVKPDGSVIVSSMKNRVEVVGGKNTVIVEGDASLNYKGNLTLNVDGDFTVNAGNVKYNTKGNYDENVKQHKRSRIGGNERKRTSGSSNEVVGKRVSKTYLGGKFEATKGNTTFATEGKMDLVSSKTMTQTTQEEYINTSLNANIASKSLSIFGDTGTIGGKNIQMYAKNVRADKTVYATETVDTKTVRAATSVETHTVRGTAVNATLFTGDLSGTASQAVTADVTNSQGYPASSTGSASGFSVASASTETAIDNDTTETAQPDADLLNEYIEKSDKGPRKVLIDVDDYLKNELQERKLDPDEVSEKMDNESIRANNEFTTKAVAEGKLNPKWSTKAPSGGTGRIIPRTPTSRRSHGQMIGNADGAGSNKTFKSPDTSLKSSKPAYFVAESLTAINQAKDISEADEKNQTNSATAAPEASTAEKLRIQKKNKTSKSDPSPVDILDSTEYISPYFELVPGITAAKFMKGNEFPTTFTISQKQQSFRNWMVHAHILRTINEMARWKNHRLVVHRGLYVQERFGVVDPDDPKKLALETLASTSIPYRRQRGNHVIYNLIGLDGEKDVDNSFEVAVDLKESYNRIFAKLALGYDEFDPSGKLDCNIHILIGDVGTDGKIDNSAFGGSGNTETKFNQEVFSGSNLVEILSSN